MLENRLLYVEKTLSRQISMLPISFCTIVKFSKFFLNILRKQRLSSFILQNVIPPRSVKVRRGPRTAIFFKSRK